MSNVTFFIFDGSEKNNALELACQLVSKASQSKQKSWIVCSDKKEAEKLDDLLWQLPAKSFVAHNLAGEGPANGTPVEIVWQMPQYGQRNVLVNLTQALPKLSPRQTIFDFVPVDEQGKQQARERYKQYRQAGCQLTTQPVNAINES